MANAFDKSIRKIVSGLTEARRSYFKEVGLETSEFLPAPASESDIARLEGVLEQSLPPSYKSFLLIQDGFPELDGETNLLGVSEMILKYQEDSSEFLSQIAQVLGDDAIKGYIVFGASDQSTSSFFFDPTVRNKDGEWLVVEYDEEEGLDSTHESFLFFLIESIKEAQDAEQEALEGKDLFDMDF